MSETTQTPIDVYAEPPELTERIDRIGFRLIASATIMFFLGFVFAYFYLRSLDNSGLWRPAGVDPPTGYGIAIVACFVLSAALFAYASRAARAGRGWVAAAGLSLLLALAGCVLQGFEYAHLSFGPQSGGYASVFFGWTALYAVVVLLTMYKVETVFAAGLRNRGRPDARPPLGFAPGAYYWALLVGIGVLAWIVLYLV